MHNDEIIHFKKAWWWDGSKAFNASGCWEWDEELNDLGNVNEIVGSGCREEAQVKINKINSSNSLNPIYLNRDVCVTQSYVIITSIGGGMYCLCHSLEIPKGQHTHVSTYLQ